MSFPGHSYCFKVCDNINFLKTWGQDGRLDTKDTGLEQKEPADTLTWPPSLQDQEMSARGLWGFAMQP